MRKKMQIMFRMDDITADMNWDKFNQVREIFEKYQICPLLGVVPDNQDKKLVFQEKQEDFWKIICSLKEKGWAIAQHGTYHKYVTEDSGLLGLKNASEFAGLPYEEQFSKLQTGKRILEGHGIHSDIFMAPGHTFDRNTIKALYNLGFQTITDGLYRRPYYYENMLMIPCRLQEYRHVKGTDTICLHSNQMSEKDIKELETFCENNRSSIISFTPHILKEQAINRTFRVTISEKIMLYIRRTKNKTANSERLAWYMQYTYDKNSRKKWINRVIKLPMLLFGGKERK